MKNKILFLIVLILYLNCGTKTYAQIYGSNLLETQYGKLPTDSINFGTAYNRSILGYDYKNFSTGVTLENYYTRYENRNYTKITQYSLKYNSDILDVSLGNFNETIGRGILLRSFEIPGAILEDQGFRSRNYFYRDVQGISAKLKLKNFTTKVIWGKPLNNVFPPNQSNSIRRIDEIKTIYSDYTFKKQTVGASFLSLHNEKGDSNYSMLTFSGTISPKINYYTEFANDIENSSTHAYYGNINFMFEKLGITAEFKDYNNFLLGSGFNEVPALIKEHTYKVLNRSTHVVQPFNESGYQIEAYYTFQNSSVLTFNNAVSKNNFDKKYLYQEYFAEYDFSTAKEHNIKVFIDYAEDPFKLQSNRISTGAYIDWKISEKSSIKTEYEFQYFKRGDEMVQNQVFNLGYAFKSKWIFSVLTELSNDSFLTNKSLKTWIGSNIKYQINNGNNLQLFAGQRRGGPACNAGICYEVLDYNGIEIRWTTRF
ncbi:DUF6029 family protein [Flavobacterium sp.]|uniref:DUF6029 family protein n=1 Tax=Flavobacterium sp. TaxID=239 RepID=UPI001B778DFC|nr:DUF6029 family protein [Flavobacterium sp.]MBP6182228.1 hypothetical protein [Flavobacterium sp.]